MIKGKVLDVAVDIRKSSPTFGKHVMVELSDENKRQFFIPRGFAHGFLVLSDEAIFTYKVDNIYAPQHEASIRWNDEDINIKREINTLISKLWEKNLKNNFKNICGIGKNFILLHTQLRQTLTERFVL